MFGTFIRYATWAWMIIIGGLLIFLPHGPIICIVCGGLSTLIPGVITAVLGIAGFTVARSNPMPGLR
jgi:hypothetical protein